MKNLILIESGEKYQFDTLQEIIESIIDKNYYNLSTDEQNEKLNLKAYANCLLDKREITNKIDKNMDVDNKFIIYDEITFILSLLTLNKVVLLESTNANILTKDLDKSAITDNYIIVNHFAKDLLKKYIENLEV